ncbi:MAG: hypothetical protein KAY24_03350 [Candidatus Eisenbacteria sp.]|nr:hypothetical protein [Candidatus Eisenbacteria bacterium]
MCGPHSLKWFALFLFLASVSVSCGEGGNGTKPLPIDTVLVKPDGTGDYPTIQAAIDTFSANNAHAGGGMYAYGSSISMANCTFSGNLALCGGGLVCDERPTCFAGLEILMRYLRQVDFNGLLRDAFRSVSWGYVKCCV